jgi:hypothetical protein
LSEHVKAFFHDKSPVSISTSPVLVYKAPFTISSYAFRPQEWSNQARDDVALAQDSAVSQRFGWLVAKKQLIIKWKQRSCIAKCSACVCQLNDGSERLPTNARRPEEQYYDAEETISIDIIRTIISETTGITSENNSNSVK